MLQFSMLLRNQIVFQQELRKSEINDKEDQKITKKLCFQLVNQMEELKLKHENPHINFDEVRSKVAKEFEMAKEEFKKSQYYPQLVYKFYFISMMFEVLTVYDINIKLREHYLQQSKESMQFSIETKERVKMQSGVDLASYSLFSKVIQNQSIDFKSDSTICIIK